MTNSNPSSDRRLLLQNALQAIDELQARLDDVERARTEPIAIVGLSCRFPGGANSPEDYWQLLCDGVDAIREVPPDRWNVNDPSASLKANPGDGLEATAWYGGFLDNIDKFDPQFFGISPREAITMDPQQRLVLEVAWEALERAGIAPDKLNGSQTGVFVGITTNDYSQLAKAGGPEQLDVYTATGSALNAAAGRLAYTLGLQGPCMAIDTACSSSLVAVHLAVQSLRSGESNMAIAGGVNAILQPEAFICFNRWGMMAPDGRCKTFDARADGFVRGEGCGVIVLKRLSDAVKDGDNILALIRGSAVNQDGRSSGLTVPNGLAQQAVLRKALNNAGVAPHEVSYVEAHGTGTALGDPIEVEALGAVLGKGRSPEQPLTLGSVKTNLGHLESASGIAGLIKVVLSLQHGEIPKHLHFQERSPKIPWPRFPVNIPTEHTAWTGKRIAGVSGFGFSGTNAHVILEEAPSREPESASLDRPTHLLTVSAKGETALRELARRFANSLDSYSLADVCFTANTGRARLTHRIAFVANSPQQMHEKLLAFADGQAQVTASKGQPKIAFLFTGQGAQYTGMARQLYQTQPTFRKTLDRCDEILRPHLNQSLLSLLYSQSEPSLLDQTAYTQPALFAIEYALAELWKSWGIAPNAVLGHSVGEYVAACVAGVFSLEDGLKLIAERGRLMGALPAGGEMAAVFADEAKVAEAVAPFADRVSIAAVNGPANVVISGAGEAVQAIVQKLEADGIKSRRLTVSHAFHSPLMEPILAEFERVAGQAAMKAPSISLISNVSAQPMTEAPDASYWRRHVRAAVRFSDSIGTLREQGYEVFVEIGPKPTLMSMGQQCWPGEAEPASWLPSLREGRDDWQVMLESLGALYVQGASVDWAGLDKDYPSGRRRVVLPTYPFQRARYWLEYKETAGQRKSPTNKRRQPLLGSRLNLAHSPDTYVWEGELNTQLFPYLIDHQVQGAVVLPATAYIEMVMEAAAEIFGEGPLALTEIENKKVLLLPEGANPVVQVALTRGVDSTACRVYSRPNRAEPSSESWMLHMTARLIQDGEAFLRHAPERQSLAEIQARCAEAVAGPDFYKWLAEKGNQWGPMFQGVEQLWRGEDEALSRVRVPAALESEVDSYQFHPAVADAGGHVLTATISMARSNDSKGGAFVGGGIQEVRRYSRPRGLQLWTYARLHRDADQPSNILVGDVQVIDEDGNVIAETLGARLWYLDADQQRAMLESPDDWFYELQWEEKPLAEKAQASEQAPGTWLIFADRSGVGEALAGSLATQSEQCVLVYAGEAYQRLADGKFHARPGHGEDMRRLLKDAFGEQGAPRGIAHLWSLDATESSLLDAQLLGGGSVMHLAQAVTQAGWPRPPRLWLVTRGAQAVAKEPSLAVAQSPIWGFGRTLALEHSELWGGLVDLETGASSESAAAGLAKVLSNQDGEDQVAFRQDRRYVARLTRKRQFSPQPFSVRADASYLITGGLGGLGLTVARWLAEQGARHLILLGRTELPPRDQWDAVEKGSRAAGQIEAIRRIEVLGASAHPAAADVADEAALRDLLEKIQARGWPPVRGVVHAAGVMQYQSLMEHDVAQMNAILQAKVAGGWLLHQLFKGAPLDFFVLFSSASSLLSSPLLASYAAANAFLDALAHHRKALGLPALSVNWGLWSEVGMGAVFGGDRAAAERGMSTISPKQGLEALERLLRQGSAQAGFIPVNWGQWQKLYPAFTEAPFLSRLLQGRAGEVDGAGAPGLARQTLLAARPEEREKILGSYLGEQAARVLGLAASSLDVNAPLNQLGLDSLMAVELKNRIELDLGVVVPMVKFLQGPTVAQLTTQVLEQAAVAPASDVAIQGSDGQTEAERLLSSLDEMSDDQVEALLASLLAEEESHE